MSNESEQTTESASYVLAGRLRRFEAFLIDSGLAMVLFFLIRAGEMLGVLVFLAAGVAFIGLAVYQWILLTRRGQTIGKRTLGIRIVKISTGENGGFVSNVLLRSWAAGLLYFIPFFLIVDGLFIYRDDRRCIHDFIAGTRVIEGAAAE